MKSLHTLLVAAATLIVAPAFAQQQAQPVHQVPHYPMSAAQYEHNVSRMLDVLRKAKPTGPITQADFNKAILIMRDCASNAEADGVVTLNESRNCRGRLAQFKRERLREVMATSTPAEWARWRSALPTGDENEQQ